MPPIYSYTEAQADYSPASASFTLRQQSASAPYFTEPVAFGDMPKRLIDVLGFTGTATTNGKISRQLPLRHPQYSWLFADSFRPRGVGTTNAPTLSVPGAGSSVLPAFPLYAEYTCDIAFSQRDYNVWQDKDVQLAVDTFYPKNDTGAGGMPDNTRSFTYATEWLRFCTFELTPLNNFVTAQAGSMRFRTDAGGANPNPSSVQYQDAPRLYLPDSSLKVKWYSVPYRYLTSPNSYLRKFIGHLNQKSFGDQINGATSFGPFDAGSLLYLGARPTAIYSNVVPDEGLLAYNAGGNGFSRARLCDLELDFIYTSRTISDAPGAPDFTTVNRDWIVGGHNLLPWMTTRSYWYCSSEDGADKLTQRKWIPSFPSFAFPLLFTDPDATTSPILEP